MAAMYLIYAASGTVFAARLTGKESCDIRV